MSDAQLDLNAAVTQLRKTVFAVGRQMDALARSMAHVGNDKVADKLVAWAAQLEEMAQYVDVTYGAALQQNLRRSEESTANVLFAVLGGMGMRHTVEKK